LVSSERQPNLIDASGDLLESGADLLVNPVNLVGVSGKGLALAFRQRFPRNYELYRAACSIPLIAPGVVLVTPLRRESPPYYVANFPTKRHWRDPSLLEDVRMGLAHLASVVTVLNVRSVAVPALGCGLGGLSWDQVKPMIVEALGDLPIDLLVYGPGSA